MRRRTSPRRWAEPLVLIAPGMAFSVVLVAVPTALVAAYAFATRGRFGGVQWQLTLENLTRLAEPVYLQVFRESLALALLATGIALVIGYPTAHAITRLPERWRTLALVGVVVPFWTNFLIRVYAWILLLNS